jgi:hypothetical protein
MELFDLSPRETAQRLGPSAAVLKKAVQQRDGRAVAVAGVAPSKP